MEQHGILTALQNGLSAHDVLYRRDIDRLRRGKKVSEVRKLAEQVLRQHGNFDECTGQRLLDQGEEAALIELEALLRGKVGASLDLFRRSYRHGLMSVVEDELGVYPEIATVIRVRDALTVLSEPVASFARQLAEAGDSGVCAVAEASFRRELVGALASTSVLRRPEVLVLAEHGIGQLRAYLAQIEPRGFRLALAERASLLVLRDAVLARLQCQLAA